MKIETEKTGENKSIVEETRANDNLNKKVFDTEKQLWYNNKAR